MAELFGKQARQELIQTEDGSIIFPSQEKVYGQINHLLDVFQRSNAAIRPHFHLTGETGTGKSHLLAQACAAFGIKMIEVNAAGITAEGLSGNSLSKALRPLRECWNEPNVIFVDEFDKLFQRNGETTEGFRSAVQDEFLTALESKHTSVFTDFGKYDQVRINNSLFVFAGAYSGQKIETMGQLRDAGLRAEFIGRVPLVFSTSPITMRELAEAVPKVALFREYRKLFPKNAVTKDVRAICKIIEDQNKEVKIGIRMLNSAIHLHYMGAK